MIAKLRRVLANPRELSDRLAQELRNLQLLLLPPSLDGPPPPMAPLLPDADDCKARLANTPHAAEIAALAPQIRAHRFPVLGITLETGPTIHWRRDGLTGRETGREYFRRIPYLDASRAGDHKLIWELNRHQHLVVLAQDHLLHANPASLVELEAQLTSWLEQNPFQRGINWASALEVAFRALSWIWIWHLAGPNLSPRTQSAFGEALYRHGLHLETNLSYYFAPNTHLLGEAVALHALGALFPGWPRAARWRATGHEVVEQQLHRQVQPDGSHFEHSSYYHVYALDMFLFHARLAQCQQAWQPVLGKMAVFLDALLGPSRRLPFLGDDDGGRFFHPYGDHATFGADTLLLGPMNHWSWPAPASTGFHPADIYFPDAGLLIRNTATAQILFDAGTFGWGPAGHSHSDALQLIVNANGEELLIDPGTYTYVADPAARDAYRGSAAHNTVRINGLDQAGPAGPFAWRGRPEVSLQQRQPELWQAACQYRGFTHTRTVHFHSDRIDVEDEVTGPAGEHGIELHWHLGPNAASRLSLPPETEHSEGTRSTALGRQEPAPVARLAYHGPLPWHTRWSVRIRW